MLRTALGLCLPLALAASAGAQNLAQNHGFEFVDVQCPSNLGQIDRCQHWFNPTAATPDFYHACGSPVVSVPDNFTGSQWGADGAAYGGIIAYTAGPEWREYLQNPFSQPMIAGATYRVRFWVSLAEDSHWAISTLGAYLSVGPVGPFATTTSLNLVPQIAHDPADYLTSKTEWEKVTDKYVAAGGEDHIVIGNFLPDFDTPQVGVSGGSQDIAYYYIDLLYVYRVDIGDITGPTDTNSNPGAMTWRISNVPPSSPAWLYWSKNLDGTLINGQLFDLGPPLHLIATAITDTGGTASFTTRSTADYRRGFGLGRTIWLEARVDDPTTGQTVDTNEHPLRLR